MSEKGLIVIENLTKRFKPHKSIPDFLKIRKKKTEIVALNNINLLIPQNKIIGFFGKNGAGKTTLLKIIAGLLIPESGSIEIEGVSLKKDIRYVKGKIGYVTGDMRSFFWRINAYENLKFFAGLNEILGKEADKRIDKVLELVDLVNEKKRLFMELSSGMKQRLSVARALLHQPNILIFDEISVSLDKNFIKKLFSYLKNYYLSKRQKVVLFTTHDLDELLLYSDYVIVLNKGEVAYCGNKLSKSKLAEFAGD